MIKIHCFGALVRVLIGTYYLHIKKRIEKTCKVQRSQSCCRFSCATIEYAPLRKNNNIFKLQMNITEAIFFLVNCYLLEDLVETRVARGI